MSIIVCNAGSSSLKLAACRGADGGALPEERIRHVVNWPLQGQSAACLLERFGVERVEDAVRDVLHRIVHAGPVTDDILRIDASVRDRIAHWRCLAPRHNTLALECMEAAGTVWPEARHWAVFDSALFRHLPDTARQYPLPEGLSQRWPIQRFGFHGLAHRNLWRQAQSKQADARRVITLQLGGGWSATAWHDDRPIDTTMGFTPLDGLPMTRRSGAIDPGIVIHLLRQERWSVEEVEQLLSEHSGLRGLSGSADMRELLGSDGPVSESARDAVVFCARQLQKQIGAAMALLGGLDAIAFGGGVGEHQWWLRQESLRGLAGLGVTLDPDGNRHAEPDRVRALHAADSRCGIYLIPVNETGEMLRHHDAVSATT